MNWRKRVDGRTCGEILARVATLSRREFILGSGMAAAFLARFDGAPASAAPGRAAWLDAMDKITGGAKPTADKIKLTFPSTPVSSESVPFKISVNHPMAPGNYVKAIHVLATETPQPEAMSFDFSPECGSADVAGRLKLEHDQEVVAIAILSTGESFISQSRVELAVPCCEAPDGH